MVSLESSNDFTTEHRYIPNSRTAALQQSKHQLSSALQKAVMGVTWEWQKGTRAAPFFSS